MKPEAIEPPSFADVKIRRALLETEPLLNPVKVAVRFLETTAELAVPLALLSQFIKMLEVGLRWAVLDRLLNAAVFTILSVPVAMLLAPLPYKLLRSMLLYQNGVPVFYLRAFRSDRVGARLRRKLQAILGREYTIAGIRPPAKRAGMLYRLFFTIPTGLRYLGSTSFRLEAGDHNWLSRLLASFSGGRFVFIDLVDVTPHVADEIRMSYLAMGIQRCVFITDETRSPAEWRELVVSFIQDPDIESKPLLTLTAPGEGKKELARLALELRSVMAKIPSGFPSIPWSALQFARSRVPKTDWLPYRFETEAGLLRLAFGVEAALCFAAVVLTFFDVYTRGHVGFNLIDGFAAISFYVLMVTFITAVFRATRQRRFVARNRSALQTTYGSPGR